MDRDQVGPAPGLRAAERAVADLSPDAVVLTVDGFIVHVNPPATALLEATAEGLVGQPWSDLVHPDSPSPAPPGLLDDSPDDGGAPSSTRLRLRRSAGAGVDVEAASSSTLVDGRRLSVTVVRDAADQVDAEQQLRMHAAVVEQVSDAVVTLDRRLRIEDLNSAAETLFGVRFTAVRGRPGLTTLGRPEVGGREVRNLRQLVATGAWQGEVAYDTPDGRHLTLEVRASVRRSPTGHFDGVLAVARDVSVERAAMAALAEREQFRQAVLDSLEAQTAVLDPDGVVVTANVAWVQAAGGALDALARPEGTNLLSALAMRRWPQGADLAAGVRGVLAGTEARISVDHRVDDEPDPCWLNTTVVPLHGGAGAVVSHTDITERKRAEAALAEQATRDVLTGLPNRSLALDRLERALANPQGDGQVALLLLDLDRLGVVNDSLGHQAGDQVLVAAAQRLRPLVAPPDTLARLVSDEFVVILEGTSRPGDAIRLAERLQGALASPTPISGQDVVVTACVGVALSAPGALSAEELLHNARVALARARARGPGSFDMFDGEQRRSALDRIETESALRHAVERDELFVVFQPIVAVADRRLVGAEALVRWHRPGHGEVQPAQFVPLAEETGLIVPIGAWVLQEACRQAARWRHQRPARPLDVSVNLSSLQLADPHLPEAVEVALAASGLPAELLCLEITETVLMKVAEGRPALAALNSLGVRVAIDDFGTGYSSLSYLKRFSVDTLKIDRSFIDGLGCDEDDSAIVAAVIGLAHALRLDVVAEGVETEAQLAALAALGCDRAQGNLFGGPGPMVG